MSTYRICEDCGAALDPGERCDCRQQGRVELIQPDSQVTDDIPVGSNCRKSDLKAVRVEESEEPEMEATR